MLLACEHVLNRRADSGALRIGTGIVLGQRPTRHALLVDIALEHAPLEERFVLLRAIGRVGPYARAGVSLADEVRQPGPVMGVGGAGIPGADQPMRPVDADVVVVAEHRDGKITRLERLRIGTLLHLGFGVLQAPARIAVLLTDLGRLFLPAPRDFALLYRGLLLVGIVLLARWHHGRIDDLAAHRQVAAIGQRCIEVREEFVDRLGFHKTAIPWWQGALGHRAPTPGIAETRAGP